MTHKLKIGLVLLCATGAFAQTQIYRSVQINKTSAIATNALGSLTISGSTATFSAAMPDTLGVGDAIVYNASLSICFIHGRTSSTVYTVKTSTGGTPTAIVTDIGWNAYRAYTTLSGWESGTENTGIPVGVRNFDSGNRNIVTNNEYWNVACYRSTDATQLSSAGWTKDETRRTRIYTPYDPTEVGTTQRHTGKNSGVRFIYNNFVSMDDGAAVNQQFVWEGIVFVMDNLNCSQLIFSQGNSSSVCEIKDCVFVGRNASSCASSSEGVRTTTTYAGTLKVSNSIFYNYDGSGANTGAGSHDAIDIDGGTAYLYNLTDFNSNFSYRRTSGTVVIKNCISNDSDTDGFTGTFDAASNYNLSDRASDAPGANSKNSRNVAFVSEGGLDFHLASTDTTAGNSGVDLSADANLAVTTDIDRDTRPTPNYVDMGADEGVSSPAATSTRRGRSFGQHNFGHVKK